MTPEPRNDSYSYYASTVEVLADRIRAACSPTLDMADGPIAVLILEVGGVSPDSCALGLTDVKAFAEAQRDQAGLLERDPDNACDEEIWAVLPLRLFRVHFSKSGMDAVKSVPSSHPGACDCGAAGVIQVVASGTVAIETHHVPARVD